MVEVKVDDSDGSGQQTIISPFSLETLLSCRSFTVCVEMGLILVRLNSSGQVWKILSSPSSPWGVLHDSSLPKELFSYSAKIRFQMF